MENDYWKEKPLESRILTINIKIKCPICHQVYMSLGSAIRHSNYEHNSLINRLKMTRAALDTYAKWEDIYCLELEQCVKLRKKVNAEIDRVTQQVRLGVIKKDGSPARRERKAGTNPHRKTKGGDLLGRTEPIHIKSSYDLINKQYNACFSREAEGGYVVLHAGMPHSNRKRF
ncbi:MAG: hypothetical protein MJZ30_06140 [Paludibacteraceae bacterium]|nr:hypothetical protein [Paludibacteraceae bacterium]